MATQTPAQTRARQAAAAGAVGAGVAARGAGGAGSGAVAAGGVGAGVAAAGILSGLVAFLASLRQRNRQALATELGRYSTQPADIAAAMAQEDALELAFARASADRVAGKLPQALRIDDPRERERQVRQILSDEERFARQRSEAMFARAIAAVTRADLRVSSPLGAFWRIGVAQDHTPGCRFMAGWPGLPGRFWPWVVLDRVHPPRHYGCTSSLHGYGDAIVNGWMTPGQVPDTRDAIAQAAGVVMEKDEAGALLAELDLRDRLVESGVSRDALSVIPFAGVSEAFNEGKHPRGYHGRFRKVGEVAELMTERSLAWRDIKGATDTPPPREQIVKNWTKQTRGRLSSDPEAHTLMSSAMAENDRNALYRRILGRNVEDHLIVTKPVDPAKGFRSLLDTQAAAHRVAGSTVISDEAVKAVAQDASKDPGKSGMRAEASSGYGLAALLRHEYGHSIDDNVISRETRAELKAALPDPGKDLSYYSGWLPQELVPELFALVTDPRYDASKWPESVQKAGAVLLRALGEE